MDFECLLQIVGDEPLFETGLLLAGEVDPNHIRRQLTRWTEAGKLYQLRRGLYSLAPPFAKATPHPFLVANRMVRGSYVSLQSALAYEGLIPETVPVTVSVAAARPRRWDTPLGAFVFRAVRRSLLSGYHAIEVGASGQALVALPEKALLDLVYLTPGGDSDGYLQSLRLQSLERLDPTGLRKMARVFAKPKVERAAERILRLAQAEREEYEAV